MSAACEGLVSFQELRAVGMATRLSQALPPGAERLLQTLAPTSLTLPGGRRVAVHYESDRPPWIESRLQDFFGMAAGPTVGGGQVPLTIHLLAPNGRPVQVTSDLASFWQKHYPPLRRELGRRYPRHSWPEDGRTAQPPPPKAPRARWAALPRTGPAIARGLSVGDSEDAPRPRLARATVTAGSVRERHGDILRP